MTIYVNGEAHYVKDFEELSLLVGQEGELHIGKCVVCEELCNNKHKSGRYVCSPECLGG